MSEIERWPRNPKKHDLDAIERSILRFGFTLPIVVDEGTGRLVAGHGRSEVLLRLKARSEPPPSNIRIRDDGEWMVPVIRGNRFASESEAEAYLVADNRLVEIAGWDYVGLLEMLSGFDAEQLEVAAVASDDLERFSRLATEQAFEERFPESTPEESSPIPKTSESVMFVAALTKAQHEIVNRAIGRAKKDSSAAKNVPGALVFVCESYLERKGR